MVFETLFDASETLGRKDHWLTPWTYLEEYEEEILNSIPYPLLQSASEHDTLETIISQHAFDAALKLYQEYKPESEQEQSDLIFAMVASSSVAYCIGTRCEWDMQYDHQAVFGLMRHLDETDFGLLNGLLDETRRNVLTTIGDIARKHERERRETHEDRVRKEERQAVSPARDAGAAGQGFEPLRDAGQGIHGKESTGQIPGTQDERENAGVLSASGGRSEGQDRHLVREGAETGKESDSAEANKRSAEAGSVFERPQASGGGSGHQRVYLPAEVSGKQNKMQGTMEEKPTVPFLLPQYAVGNELEMDGESYVIASMTENEITLSQPDMPIFTRVMARSDFDAMEKTFVEQPHDYLKDALMLTTLANGFEKIHEAYRDGSRGKAFVDFIKKPGYSGGSFTFDTLEDGFVTVETKGIEIDIRKSEGRVKENYSWNQVAKAVTEMIESGQYPKSQEARDAIWRERHQRHEREIIGLPSDEEIEMQMEERLRRDLEASRLEDAGEMFKGLVQKRWEDWTAGSHNHFVREYRQVHYSRHHDDQYPERVMERKAETSPKMLKVIEGLQIGDEVFFEYVGDQTQTQMIYDLDFNRHQYQYIDNDGRFNMGNFSSLAYHLEKSEANRRFLDRTGEMKAIIAEATQTEQPELPLHHREFAPGDAVQIRETMVHVVRVEDETVHFRFSSAGVPHQMPLEQFQQEYEQTRRDKAQLLENERIEAKRLRETSQLPFEVVDRIYLDSDSQRYEIVDMDEAKGQLSLRKESKDGALGKTLRKRHIADVLESYYSNARNLPELWKDREKVLELNVLAGHGQRFIHEGDEYHLQGQRRRIVEMTRNRIMTENVENGERLCYTLDGFARHMLRDERNQNREDARNHGVSAELAVAEGREVSEMLERDTARYDGELEDASQSLEENETAERKPLQSMPPGKIVNVLRDVVSQGTGDWLVDTVVIALYLTGRLENFAENAIKETLHRVMNNTAEVLPELQARVEDEGIVFEDAAGGEFASWEDLADAALPLMEQELLALPESMYTREAQMNEAAVIHGESTEAQEVILPPGLSERERELFRYRGAFEVIADETVLLDGNRHFIMPSGAWRHDNLHLQDVTPGMTYPISQELSWARFVREFEANPANRIFDEVLTDRQLEIDETLMQEDEQNSQLEGHSTVAAQTPEPERNVPSQSADETIAALKPGDVIYMTDSDVGMVYSHFEENGGYYIFDHPTLSMLKRQCQIQELRRHIENEERNKTLVAPPAHAIARSDAAEKESDAAENVLPFQSKMELEKAAQKQEAKHVLENVILPRIEVLREEARRDEMKEAAQQSIVDRDENIIRVDLMDDVAKRRKESEPNYYYPSEHGLDEGGVKTKYKRNIAAIRLLKEIEQREETAKDTGASLPSITREEQQILSLYAGWGGMPQVFEPNKEGWQHEYEELAELLTEEEYRSAFQSVWSAFYTPPEIIGEIYRGIENMGFEDGRILDPCMGTGHFFGAMPESLRHCHLTGIELDKIPGRISKQLYPNADIRVKGYQDVYIPNNYFDVAVGNVPFGQVKVHDSDYDAQGLSIHDYFFSKTLDKVREGGVVAFITSTYTLDQKDGRFRKYMAERANLLGAVRLPSKAFSKVSHTDASADILFLQKRSRVRETMPSWVDIAATENGVPVNAYFAENPHMMLGELTFDPKFYGNENSTLLHAHEGRDWHTLLHEAIDQIKGEIKPYKAQEFVLDEDGNALERWYATPDIKNNTYTVLVDTDKQEHIYYRNGPDLERVDTRSQNRLRAMMDVRDAARYAIRVQLPHAFSGIGVMDDALFQKALDNLNKTYDDFVKRYGSLNKRSNQNLFREDIDAPFLLSLENVDEQGNAHKADIFFKRTVFPPREITSVETAQEALSVSLSRRGFVDLPYMVSLVNKEEQAVIEELGGQIFRNPNELAPPEKHWLTSAEYLSGNVRIKLEQAEQLAAQDERFLPNVKALREVQPDPIPADGIQISLGANWIPPEDIQAFTKVLFENSRMHVDYSNVTGQWKLDGHMPWSVASEKTYGTERANGYKLLEMTLNQKSARFYDKITVRDEEGNEKTVRKLNGPDSAIAIRMQTAIRQKFEEWVREDPLRMERLAKIYNERFNSERLCHYDGQFLDFPGMNPARELREHQKDAVARIIYGGNTLLAHEVGTGKTYTMIAAAMKKKQLGLANKQVITVPKHLVRQFGKDFLDLYPQANILVATERDFETNNRRRFLSKIATNEFDAIIMSHEQFGRIPLSPEKQRELLEVQAEEIRAGLLAVSDKESFNAKRMAKMLDNLEAKQARLEDSINTGKDRMLCMEEMGIDGLFVDEAHAFKNLPFTSNLENVSGLSNGVSQRAVDMRTKVQYLNELTGNQNVTFSTGTPVSNTIAEAYLMQKYLQSDYLKEMGLNHFDAWVANFAEPTTQMELKPTGDGYRPRTRFTYFNNLPELLHQFHRIADVKFADDLPDIDRPEIAGGKMQTIVAEPSETQAAYISSLGDRADAISNGAVTPDEDNMLLICTDGRKAALDMRLIDPLAPEFEGSKTNLAADNIARIYKETTDNHSTQLVFSDMGTPNSEGRYSVYQGLKEKLMERGITENEIAFIHDAAKNEEKEALFARMRTGDLRVLVGSTQKCGAGTNVQDKMIALHHLDCPWKPSDVEQRNGRGHRQGNENSEIRLYNYVTRNSFDAYNWQIIEQKQRIVGQIMRGDISTRRVKDIDEVVQQYAEIKAVASGNPLIREKVTVENQVKELEQLKAAYTRKRNRLKDDIQRKIPDEQALCEKRVESYGQDKVRYESNNSDDFSIQFAGKTYESKKEAGEAMTAALRKVPIAGASPTEIGEYKGFTIEAERGLDGLPYLYLKGSGRYRVEVTTSESANMNRIEHMLDHFEDRQLEAKERLVELEKEYQDSVAELRRPFAQQEELNTALAQLTTINDELNLNENVVEIGNVMEDGGIAPNDETQQNSEEMMEI